MTTTTTTTTYTLNTAKGSFTGSLIACLRWQAEHQGAFASLDDVDISDLSIAAADDAARDEGDITPEEAMPLVLGRLVTDEQTR